MSQLYHIQLKTTVTREISASDAVTYPIELTQILPEAEMLELLRQALLDKGWQQQEDGTLTNTGSANESLTIDLEKRTLVAELGAHKNVTTEVGIDQTVDAWTQEDAERYGKSLLDEKVADTKNRLDDQTNTVQKEVTQRLIESEQQRMQLINEALQDVYRDSLKRKAEQLGDVTSIHESTNENGEYELVIKVSQ